MICRYGSAGITRFDMDEEKDEGHFDDDGNFVWDIESKKLQEEAWLENLSEQQMSAAMNAKSRVSIAVNRKKKQRQRRRP
ncbi:putative CD2 antigen cytoplasmic tail-binding protein 2/Lin1 [Plasmopara halstedii]